MIPTRGWRDREARARSRYGRNVSDPEVEAERARIYAERDAAITALEPTKSNAPVGIVTAAKMHADVASAPADVTPDEDAPAPPAEPEPPAAPKTTRKKA